jgi:hypothetical protein
VSHLDTLHIIVTLVDAFLSPELIAINRLGKVDYIFSRLALAFGQRDPVRWTQQFPSVPADTLLVI